MKSFITILFCLLIALGVQAQTMKKFYPDFAQLQFAGSMGFLSAGIGYDFSRDKIHISILDGFTPKSIAGSNINTLNLRGAYDIINIKIFKRNLTPYAGLTLSFETTGNAFYGKLPERYSDGYYKNSAIHFMGFGGVKYPIHNFKNRQSLSLYAETGTVDSYMYYYFSNDEQNFGNMFSLSLGAIYQF